MKTGLIVFLVCAAFMWLVIWKLYTDHKKEMAKINAKKEKND
ncbi:MAG: hypothetical protein ACFFC1_19190 [Promethearchaeota archaeon]